MYVLALDTALAACSVAVLDSRHGILASASVPMRRGHAEALLPSINHVMDDAGVAFSDLDRIAVTVGPGSFTGLRVGVSAARGIALAAGKPAVGVTTLAAFAAPALILAQGTPVLAVVDARHGQFYAQTVGDVGAAEARMVSLSEIMELASAPIRIAGNCIDLVAAAWPRGRPSHVAVDASEAPDIGWVARLGATSSLNAGPKPFYLRAADARPQASQLPQQ
ncbi:MAG: tRNA (adenosine(37)-N6)-threonylcarbamoyltransferase complex dimerization subunit type 1 TsaB [Xanthobacteraceae bacterium]|jgi:tRNA threonylcarbamoyladenosine biosynthesis protein TsaB